MAYKTHKSHPRVRQSLPNLNPHEIRQILSNLNLRNIDWIRRPLSNLNPKIDCEPLSHNLRSMSTVHGAQKSHSQVIQSL